jgi:hypothetical protein
MASKKKNPSMSSRANRSLDSYVQDTADFLKKLSNVKQPLPVSSALFCMDDKALYASIPRKEARDIIKKALQEHHEKEVDTESLLKMTFSQKVQLWAKLRLCLHGRVGKNPFRAIRKYTTFLCAIYF